MQECTKVDAIDATLTNHFHPVQPTRPRRARSKLTTRQIQCMVRV